MVGDFRDEGQCIKECEGLLARQYSMLDVDTTQSKGTEGDCSVRWLIRLNSENVSRRSKGRVRKSNQYFGSGLKRF